MILRAVVCILFLAFSMYSYIDKQNHATWLKIRIPEIAKEIKAIRQENARLRYAIDQFESPENLLQIAHQYPRLKHPVSEDILTLAQGSSLPIDLPAAETSAEERARLSLTLGAKTE